MKKKTIIHVAPFALWDSGKGKGRVSTYIPIKELANNGYDNIYITYSSYASPDDDSEQGIQVVKINKPFADTRFSYKNLSVAFLFSYNLSAFSLSCHKNGKKTGCGCCLFPFN